MLVKTQFNRSKNLKFIKSKYWWRLEPISLCTPLSAIYIYMKMTCFLHPCYHPKIIQDPLDNVQKPNVFVFMRKKQSSKAALRKKNFGKDATILQWNTYAKV